MEVVTYTKRQHDCHPAGDDSAFCLQRFFQAPKFHRAEPKNLCKVVNVIMSSTKNQASTVSRRTILMAGAVTVVSLLEGQMSKAENARDNAAFKAYDIATNNISLHVTEVGSGPTILFVHGFPDTAYTWRKQMQAVASAGFRAIAPDMRGYGGSSAPTDPALYTPLQTVGDLVGLLDALQVPQAIVVGHDWGANVAWNAALMRPDRFKAVFCLAVPYSPRGKDSVLDAMRAAGHEKDFYMFEQIQPAADQTWADATVTIPGALYWASGSASAAEAWNPLDPTRSLHRRAPGQLPAWFEPDYVQHNIKEFQRTGFHGALNYYRAVQPFFELSAAYAGTKISQPSYFVWGRADGLFPIYHLTEETMRDRLPGLKGYVGLAGVGHWVQHEATDRVNQDLVTFARSVG
ncbi:alpha/beta fold hydrolase [Rhizobium sp. A22-96]